MWFVGYTAAVVLIGSLFNDGDADASINRSYFNAMLLQQQQMAKLLEEQAAAIEKLKKK